MATCTNLLSIASQLPARLFLDALGTLVALEPPAPRLRDQLELQLGVQVTLSQAQRAISAEISYYRAHLQAAKDAREPRPPAPEVCRRAA